MKLTKIILRDSPYVVGFILWEVFVLVLSGNANNMQYSPLIYIIELLYFYCLTMYILPMRTKDIQQRLLKGSLIIGIVVLAAAARLSIYGAIAKKGEALLILSSRGLIMAMLYREVNLLGYAGAYWLGIERNKKANRLKQEVLEIENKRVILENMNLLAQIDRHTQLNAYNKLYSLVMPHSDRAANLVLALGEQEQFSLQDIDENGKIPLCQEIGFLETMIKLERLCAEQLRHIEVSIDGIDQAEHLRIPPKLLVPLLENVFKHGITDEADCPAHLHISVTDHQLLIETQNNKLSKRNIPSYNIGLVNIKNRLQNFYPDAHEMQIIETDEVFYLSLKITL